MSISGLVVQTRPENVENLSNTLSLMTGVEVHTTTETGSLVVTVDLPDDAQASETFSKFMEIEGVLNTSMIYNYFEQDNADKELVQ